MRLSDEHIKEIQGNAYVSDDEWDDICAEALARGRELADARARIAELEVKLEDLNCYIQEFLAILKGDRNEQA